jgi:hypothetical protein
VRIFPIRHSLFSHLLRLREHGGYGFGVLQDGHLSLVIVN